MIHATIPLVRPFMPPREILVPELEKVLYSGYIAEGEPVRDFETRFGQKIGNAFCLSVNSGTAALHIALLLAGVGRGDEVISTALTAEPTNVAIKLVGATVRWADIDASTGLLDPESVRQRITARTKAIMLVHYAGMVCDLEKFNQISAEYGVPLIEDAAHALGSKFQGTAIGSNSPYTAFSFQAIKHMTTVDGGILAVKNQADWDAGRLRRWFGLDKTRPRLDNDIRVLGYKYHMNNVNATVGLVQLRYLDQVVNTCIGNGKFYDEQLKGICGLQQVTYCKNTEASYWLYTMKVERRSEFINLMAENGIVASELHQRNDRHSIFGESRTNLPQLDEFYGQFVHIPCGWWVTNEDREYIVDRIKRGW